MSNTNNQQPARPVFDDAVLTGLSNMCEAANSAHPAESFMVRAEDLLPVARFIHQIMQASGLDASPPRSN